MRACRIVFLGCWLTTAPLQAQDMLDSCRASSSYDVTVQPTTLLFDRAQPAPQRVSVQGGILVTDGMPVRLTPAQRDHLVLFERQLRALLPRVKAVALQGVDLAMRAVDSEAASLSLSAATRAELDQRLAAHAAALKQQINSSRSTHDWDASSLQQQGQQIGAELAPLVMADLSQQALSDAMNGDIQGAAALRDRAAGLASTFQPYLQQQMQALQPQIQALCPAIRALAELQEGIPDALGRPLNLLQIGS